MRGILNRLGLLRASPHPLQAGGATSFVPTHRHRKGGDYRFLATGIDEATREPVVIYDDADGTIWVRAKAEFEDGRFTPLKTDAANTLP